LLANHSAQAAKKLLKANKNRNTKTFFCENAKAEKNGGKKSQTQLRRSST
jgi:hypothetical protein